MCGILACPFCDVLVLVWTGFLFLLSLVLVIGFFVLGYFFRDSLRVSLFSMLGVVVFGFMAYIVVFQSEMAAFYPLVTPFAFAIIFLGFIYLYFGRIVKVLLL